MQEVIYNGEHLWPGQLGHLCILLGFVSLAFSIYCYYQQSKNDLIGKWNELGRLGFYLHSFSLWSLLFILFYMMKSQMYEYQYVQAHVSQDLPMKYILSAFWEGQEGSFMLWMFWHTVLGILVSRSSGKWEAPVMVIIGLVQLFINSMILGLHIEIGDFIYKFGINPTLLLRETMDIPLFNNPDYVSLLSGEGLNPLLQNYWMTIHPPTVFFGFATVTIPFAFAIAAFWKKDYTGWLEPGLRWSLVSGTMLGLGIFMGCVWAYVALTFGGYWAWDPVENMSLVPWLLMVGGIHATLIAKHTGYSIRSAYIMFVLSFITLLYSTFLTRSGVLGDTSVHAFTEMGLEWQLVSFIAFFLILGVYYYAKRRKDVAIPVKEESIYSREFWMQIGVLVLLFSSILITVATSLPVYNKVMEFFDPEFVGKVIEDPVAHHNRFQLWIAVFIAVLSAKVIFMRYKTQQLNRSITKLVWPFMGIAVVAGIATYLSSLWISYNSWQYTLLALCGYFSLFANLYYLFQGWRLNPRLLAMTMAHAGFGIMLIGVIASGLNAKTISSNPFGQRDILDEEQVGKVVKLIKDKPFFVKDYWITYEKDTIINRERFFEVKFDKINEKGEVIDSFRLLPNVLFTNDFQKVAAQNPATKRYLGHDVFAYVAGLPAAQMDVELAKKEEDSTEYKQYDLAIGETLEFEEFTLTPKGYHFNPKHKDFNEHDNDLGIEYLFELYSKQDSQTYLLNPALGLENNLLYQYPHQLNELNLKIRLANDFLERIYTPEPLLSYDRFTIKQGSSFEDQGVKIELVGLERDIKNKKYKQQEGDIAIAANLTVKTENGTYQRSPVYVIRGNKPLGIKEYIPEEGMHLRLLSIDPVKETFEFGLFYDRRDNQNVSFEIAEKVPRNDIIVLRAISFPGINLFWLGCSLMIFGLFIGFLKRMIK